MPKDLGITDETWRRGAPRYYPSHDVDAGLRAAFADERAQERLRVASDLLACQPGLLGGCVRSVGTATAGRGRATSAKRSWRKSRPTTGGRGSR